MVFLGGGVGVQMAGGGWVNHRLLMGSEQRTKGEDDKTKTEVKGEK